MTWSSPNFNRTPIGFRSFKRDGRIPCGCVVHHRAPKGACRDPDSIVRVAHGSLAQLSARQAFFKEHEHLACPPAPKLQNIAEARMLRLRRNREAADPFFSPALLLADSRYVHQPVFLGTNVHDETVVGYLQRERRGHGRGREPKGPRGFHSTTLRISERDQGSIAMSTSILDRSVLNRSIQRQS